MRTCTIVVLSILFFAFLPLQVRAENEAAAMRVEFHVESTSVTLSQKKVVVVSVESLTADPLFFRFMRDTPISVSLVPLAGSPPVEPTVRAASVQSDKAVLMRGGRDSAMMMHGTTWRDILFAPPDFDTDAFAETWLDEDSSEVQRSLVRGLVEGAHVGRRKEYSVSLDDHFQFREEGWYSCTVEMNYFEPDPRKRSGTGYTPIGLVSKPILIWIGGEEPAASVPEDSISDLVVSVQAETTSFTLSQPKVITAHVALGEKRVVHVYGHPAQPLVLEPIHVPGTPELQMTESNGERLEMWKSTYEKWQKGLPQSLSGSRRDFVFSISDNDFEEYVKTMYNDIVDEEERESSKEMLGLARVGPSVQHKINLDDAFKFEEPGLYAFKAAPFYYLPSGEPFRDFRSKPILILITEDELEHEEEEEE